MMMSYLARHLRDNIVGYLGRWTEAIRRLPSLGELS